MKIYRGSPSAARHYVEADRSRADDYYLAEGTGLADWYVATCPPGTQATAVRLGGTLDGNAYERWVAGEELTTGAPKGRLRTDAQGVRFVEVVVNGPKTWSLAAAVHPKIAAAYDAAQDRAAVEIIGWLAAHATTRVGPRGRQVQVPVEQLEAAVIRHYTSRAGDPHRHLHLQINARVWAYGAWRGIHTVGIRDSLEAINGIGHAAVMCDPEFRAAITRHGYHFDIDNNEIAELAEYVGPFSARSSQIGRNVDRYEAEWRADHPSEEPGPRLRQAWDTRAWAQARPDKVVPQDGADMARHWVTDLFELGFEPPQPAPPSTYVPSTPIGALDRELIAETVLLTLAERRSAWNRADVRGVVEKLIASVGVVADPAVRVELTEDLTSRALRRSVALVACDCVPGHVRSWSSQRVLDVEADLDQRLRLRALTRQRARVVIGGGLDDDQLRAVGALIGRGRLLVVEGAAGAGKTTTLAAARELLDQQGQRLAVVTPTNKAARVAGEEVEGDAFTAKWLIHQHGFRWDDGRWTRRPPHGLLDPRADLDIGDVLVIDEAGMVDQDTALALLQVADERGARVVLLGDRHQLPAVGRGGVLDLAARAVGPEGCLTLDTVHRFTDPGYAHLTTQMRTGERPGEVFDQLVARGELLVHATEVERQAALADIATGHSNSQRPLVIADTREQVANLNAVIRDRRLETSNPAHETEQPLTTLTTTVTTNAGEVIGVGDRVATRHNDSDLGVVNRDTWTVSSVGSDFSLLVTGRIGGHPVQRHLPDSYVRVHVELAHASTVHGAQGETVDTAHLLIGDHTGAASAYVGMTRGRHHNTAHLVADTLDEARQQWIEVFSRDRADLGPGHATQLAVEDIERYGAAAVDPDSARLRNNMLRQQRWLTPVPPSVGTNTAPGVGR